MKKKFEGIYPYLVSPIEKNGQVKEKQLRKLVSYLIDCGVHGLAPLGSTGEFSSLNWEQKKEIVRIVIDETNGRVPVIAGVGSSSIADAVMQAKKFEAMGVDGILAILLVYFPLKQSEIYEYYASVANAVKCPIVLYNNCKCSGFIIENKTLIDLSKLPNVEYYKDASNDTGKLFGLTIKAGNDLKIFSASSHVPLFVMQIGGVGWMAGPSCIIPKQSIKLYELFKENKMDEAMKLQKKLWRINLITRKYSIAACVKAGLNIQGFDVGDPIEPLSKLPEEGVQEMKQILEYLKDF